MVDLSKCTILVVDDVEENIDILVDTLSHDYDVLVAMDGPSMFEILATNLPDLILLDVIMPGMNGYEIAKKLSINPITKEIPVVFLTALNNEEEEAYGLSLGAVDYITKPFKTAMVKARVKNHLELKLHRDNLKQLVAEKAKEVIQVQDVTIESLGILAEYRDPETGAHINRTKNYVKAIAVYLYKHTSYREYLSPEIIETLWKSAPLHDIGKIGIADHILLKPSKLTDDEFIEMKSHSKLGYDAIRSAAKRLSNNSFLSSACEIAKSHHEKWDGSGYPDGLRGEEIPLSGRIMSIADVYDALISERCYKKSFSHEKAVEIIHSERGKHFDPIITDAFMTIHKQLKETARKNQCNLA